MNDRIRYEGNERVEVRVDREPGRVAIHFGGNELVLTHEMAWTLSRALREAAKLATPDPPPEIGAEWFDRHSSREGKIDE